MWYISDITGQHSREMWFIFKNLKENFPKSVKLESETSLGDLHDLTPSRFLKIPKLYAGVFCQAM